MSAKEVLLEMINDPRSLGSHSSCVAALLVTCCGVNLDQQANQKMIDAVKNPRAPTPSPS